MEVFRLTSFCYIVIYISFILILENKRDLRNQGHLEVYRLGEVQNEERERICRNHEVEESRLKFQVNFS